MKSAAPQCLLFAMLVSFGPAQADTDGPWALPAGLPPLPSEGPALCQGAYLTPAQGKAMLDATLEHCRTRADWEARAALLRRGILKGAGLDPLPLRTPLNPIIRSRRVHDGYSVENVALEVVPGYYATGNLYRPVDAGGLHPAVISTHGHGPLGVPDQAPRYSEPMQIRCAALARMGAMVLSLDMFGYGESAGQVDPKAHHSTLAMTMQLWDEIRAVDFLESLDGVDPRRIAISGESGGATQDLLLVAVDSRIAVSVPVVMVSSFFYGGCECESGRPIHRNAEYFTTNAEIAALAAPRPMLVVSDGADWTRLVPDQEYPFLRRIYGLLGAEKNVENVHLPLEKHDYGPSKRAAMYRFMAARLGLDLAAIVDSNGKIDERSHYTPELPSAMRVFTASAPVPADSLKGAEAVAAELVRLQVQNRS